MAVNAYQQNGMVGMDHNTNPTSLQARTVFNARPSPDAESYRARHGDNALYPRVDRSDNKRKLVDKSNLAFFVTEMPELDSSPTDIMERDFAYAYSDCEGLFSASYKNRLFDLIPHIRVLGIWTDDVLTTFNTKKETTVATNGKETLLNTGTQRIHAGDLLMWDLPIPDKDALANSGAAKDEGRPDRPAPLWIMPYDPEKHRATPAVVHRLVTEKLEGAVPAIEQQFGAQDAGMRRFADQAVDQLMIAGFSLIKILGELDVDLADTNKLQDMLVLQTGDKVKDAKKAFTDRFFGLIGDEFDMAPLPFDQPKQISGTLYEPKPKYASDKYMHLRVGTSSSSMTRAMRIVGGLGNDPSRLATSRKISAPTKLVQAFVDMDNFYRDRVFGLAVTPADPGLDFDAKIFNSKH